MLLLEDFSDYVASGFPLRDLAKELGHHASNYVVAATCRDRPEVSVIRGLMGTHVGRFYGEVMLKLTLEPLNAPQQVSLTRELGKHLDQERSAYYPSPGSVATEEPMKPCVAASAMSSPDHGGTHGHAPYGD